MERRKRKIPMEHILSLSYGKDSLACLGAIEKLGWPLDRIIHARSVGYGYDPGRLATDGGV